MLSFFPAHRTCRAHPFLSVVCALALLFTGWQSAAAAAPTAGVLDTLTFGDAASEDGHHVAADHSDTIKGLLGEPARRLLAPEDAGWQGGRAAFTMRVDPDQPVYFMVRLSGSDRSTDRLILYCEGLQIGCRHLGDIDVLDSPNGSPGCLGRFFYETTPLPPAMTRGRTAVVQRTDKEATDLLASKGPLNQLQLGFLARAYAHRAAPTRDNPALARKAVETLDRLYTAFRADPKFVHDDPSMYNPDWFGVGPAAQSVVILADVLRPSFDQPIDGAPGVTRRAGWTEMFAAGRDWHRENRREYTNQSMISDTYGIYLADRGVAVLDPPRALPEARTLRYLHESVGLAPWLGSAKDGEPTRPLGDQYHQFTARGLTRELGFVGYSGEVLDGMTSMYDATRPVPGRPGDPALLAQLVKAAKARAVFRHPALDDDGNRAMRAEAVVGWHDQDHYPGDITYQERPTWDASAIASAATLVAFRPGQESPYAGRASF